jgi:phosphatidylglycerophosphate synthase
MMPKWSSPDFFTLTALVSAILSYFLYLAAGNNLLWLWGVNMCLIVHWLADSMDGEIARFRQDERPRYGFYIDHLFDTFALVLFIKGISSSTLVKTSAWDWLLILMLISMIHIFLKTNVTGMFEATLNLIGPTEARLGLIIANCVVLLKGNFQIFFFGFSMNFFDLLGWLGVGSIMILLISQIGKTIITLNQEDRMKQKVHQS